MTTWQDEYATLLDDCLAEVRRLTDDYAAATHLLADRDAHIERLKAELATLRAAAASVQADQRAEIDAANAVIDELLACDDLRTRAWKINPVEPGYEKEILMDEYRRRNRVAWNAARALRKGTT